MKAGIWLLVCATIAVEFSSCNNNGVGPITSPTPVFIGMDGMLVTKLVHEKPYLYAGAAANGLWRRDMEKMTDWEYLGLADTTLGRWSNLGVVDLDIRGRDMLVSYNSAVADVDPRTTVGIWRSTDGGMRWFRSDGGIPETITDPNDYNVVSTCQRSPDKPDVAIGVYSAAVYRSTDGGYQWSLIAGKRGIAGGDDHERWNPFQPGEIWGWGTTSVFQPYLGAAKDYGLSGKVGVDFFKLGFPSDQIVSDVAFDCGDPDIIHVATSQGLMKSTDGGYNWVVGKAAIPDSGYIFCMIEHPSKAGVLFLAGGSSIYYSRDAGETIQVLTTVPVQFIESLAIDEVGQRLFLGSAKGVYEISFSSVVNLRVKEI